MPFVAKATGVPIAKVAARLMAGESLASFDLGEKAAAAPAERGHVAIKESVFPFARFPEPPTVDHAPRPGFSHALIAAYTPLSQHVEAMRAL